MTLEEVVREIESPVTECRTLREGDELPKDSSVISADKDWVWVAVKENAVQAVIVACPYHGAVFVGRIMNHSRNDRVLIYLLRKFISDITARGYGGLFTFLNNDLPVESKLASIFDLAGGEISPGLHVAVGVALPMKRKW